MSRGKVRFPLPGLIAGSLALAVLVASALVLDAQRRLSAFALGGLGESFPSAVYGTPFFLGEGTVSSPERLLQRLERLGYRSTEEPPSAPGEYRWGPPDLEIHLKEVRTPFLTQEAILIRMRGRDGLWSVEEPEGGRFLLEPERVAELSGPTKLRREPAAWSDLPRELVTAVVAAEDKRFFSHRGLDPKALARAAWHTLSGRGLQGGSTITQQLAKNFFLSPRRTLWRKASEAVLAFYLEARYSKEEILLLYLNHIYLGQDGPVSIAGVRAASRHYFGKELRGLDLAECALLAGLIRSPLRYNPLRDPDAARLRRNQVLRLMARGGMLEAASLRAALAEPVRVRAARAAPRDANAWFVAAVLRELAGRYGEDALTRWGLAVQTTMDPLLQADAHAALASCRPQCALVALDPATGEVRALAGGRDFRESQFDRTEAMRQPGSAFKPFVYGAALERGLTAATLLLDAATTYPATAAADAAVWAPRNYDGIYLGTVTVRVALAHSLNAATLDLARQAGAARVVAFARRLGVGAPVEPTLGVALGVYEVTLRELTAAYAPFANGGSRVRPTLVRAVADAEGVLLESSEPEASPAIDPALAALMTSLLTDVVREGTAKGLAHLGWERPSAGKTGTTNGGRDAWFVGYTPELLAGVWVGADRQVPGASAGTGLSGPKDAVPLWAAFMRRALLGAPPAEFGRPPGLVEAKIDPASGLLAVTGCSERRRELFLEGTQPRADCPLHAGGVRGWFRRIFGLP